MFIKAYGTFWEREAVEWSPGQGSAFRLLGRSGTNLPGLRLLDIRHQPGIYVLYNDYGPQYVGLTYTSMGKRLKDHTTDIHAPYWTRFSWFGFRKVLKQRSPDGTQKLAQLGTVQSLLGNTRSAIGDIEALLIQAMGAPGNTNSMYFQQADRWEQVPEGDETDRYLSKIGL